MPRTKITPQRPVSTGLSLVLEAANALGNSIPADDRSILVVANGSAAAVNVTVPTPAVVDGDLAVPDRVVAVAAGATMYLAGFSGGAYRQPDQTVSVDYSAVASVNVAVLQL